jgi:hypothetical protein
MKKVNKAVFGVALCIFLGMPSISLAAAEPPCWRDHDVRWKFLS